MFNIALTAIEAVNPAIAVSVARLLLNNEQTYTDARPAYWLSLPDPEENEITFLVSFTGSVGYACFKVCGNYTVEVIDYDAAPTQYTSMAKCELSLPYDANRLVGNNGECQYVVKIKSADGFSITDYCNAEHSVAYSVRNSVSSGSIMPTYLGYYDVVDIKFNTPNIVSLSLTLKNLCYAGFLVSMPLLSGSYKGGTSCSGIFSESDTVIYYGFFASAATQFITAFSYNKNVKSINIADGVNYTTIDSAFLGDAELSSIVLPRTLNSCVSLCNAFAGCNKLLSVSIPAANSCTLTSSLFYGCANLTSVTFPASLPLCASAENMFNSCFSLLTVTLPGMPSCTSIAGIFNRCYSLDAVIVPSLANCVYCQSAFCNCGSLNSVTFPATLPACLSIDDMFAKCNAISSITLPLLPLCLSAKRVFMFCNSLKLVTIPTLPSCISIESMFSNCTALKTVSFASLTACTSMKDLFSDCHDLDSVSFPAIPACTDMSGIFRNCYSLRSLTFNSAQSGWEGVAFDISSSKMWTRAGLLTLFNSLPTITTSKVITLGSNSAGALALSAEDLAIASNKNWSVWISD